MGVHLDDGEHLGLRAWDMSLSSRRGVLCKPPSNPALRTHPNPRRASRDSALELEMQIGKDPVPEHKGGARDVLSG